MIEPKHVVKTWLRSSCCPLSWTNTQQKDSFKLIWSENKIHLNLVMPGVWQKFGTNLKHSVIMIPSTHTLFLTSLHCGFDESRSASLHPHLAELSTASKISFSTSDLPQARQWEPVIPNHRCCHLDSLTVQMLQHLSRQLACSSTDINLLGVLPSSQGGFGLIPGKRSLLLPFEVDLQPGISSCCRSQLTTSQLLTDFTDHPALNHLWTQISPEIKQVKN